MPLTGPGLFAATMRAVGPPDDDVAVEGEVPGGLIGPAERGRRPRPTDYWHLSRSHTYGFLMAMPLFVLYEWWVRWMNRANSEELRNSADLVLRGVAQLVGIRSTSAFAILLLTLGGLVFLREQRRERLPIRVSVCTGMLLESAFWAVMFGGVVAALTATVMNRLSFMAPAAVGDLPLTQRLILSLGAGLYEELLFRVLLVAAISWLLTRTRLGSAASVVASVLLSAAIFSLIHFLGPFGDAPALDLFVYRFIAGVAFSSIYVLRGFGIVSWTHAFYDVFVVLGSVG